MLVLGIPAVLARQMPESQQEESSFAQANGQVEFNRGKLCDSKGHPFTAAETEAIEPQPHGVSRRAGTRPFTALLEAS